MTVKSTIVTQESVGILLCVHAGADPDQFDSALASMRAQTYSNVRLFIYCDGPLTDAHEASIKKYTGAAGSGDHVIHGTLPAGLPSGLNTLIDYALLVGDVTYLARMDADDLSMPERIAKQVSFLRDHPDVSVVGTWCIEFHQPDVPAFHKQMPTDHADLIKFMLYRSPFNHPTVMFRRSVFEQGYRYNPDLKLMQDYDLWSRLVSDGLIIGNVPEYLLWFRIEKNFYSRRSGFRRAMRETHMRIKFAQGINQLRLTNFLNYTGLFLVRIAPVRLKKISYKYLRNL
jgi:glycosyltransferase involved in cell wall biosynthesis